MAILAKYPVGSFLTLVDPNGLYFQLTSGSKGEFLDADGTTNEEYGTIGSSASFDGSSHLQPTSQVGIITQNDFIMGIQFRCTSTARMAFCGKWTDGDSDGYQFGIDNGQIRADISPDQSGLTTFKFGSVGEYNDGNWHSVAIAGLRALTMYCLVDTVFVGSGSWASAVHVSDTDPPNFITGGASLFEMGSVDDGLHPFTGNLRGFYLYTGELSISLLPIFIPIMRRQGYEQFLPGNPLFRLRDLTIVETSQQMRYDMNRDIAKIGRMDLLASDSVFAGSEMDVVGNVLADSELFITDNLSPYSAADTLKTAGMVFHDLNTHSGWAVNFDTSEDALKFDFPAFVDINKAYVIMKLERSFIFTISFDYKYTTPSGYPHIKISNDDTAVVYLDSDDILADAHSTWLSFTIDITIAGSSPITIGATDIKIRDDIRFQFISKLSTTDFFMKNSVVKIKDSTVQDDPFNVEDVVIEDEDDTPWVDVDDPVDDDDDDPPDDQIPPPVDTDPPDWTGGDVDGMDSDIPPTWIAEAAGNDPEWREAKGNKAVWTR